MKLLRDFPLSITNGDSKTSITLGTFDGVHIGHRHILREVISLSKNTGEKSLVLTFDRHPISVLKPGSSPKLITTLEEKLALFENIGIDITCVISFTRQVAELTAKQFIKNYLINRLNMGTLIVGYDHGFGNKSEKPQESFDELSRLLNFSLKVIDPVKQDGLIVKSSEIRSLILEGNMESASVLLGADYSIKGKVVKGNRLGRKIGIPTANIEPENTEKILPAHGVYAGWVEYVGKRRRAVISIGSRPTFGIENEAIEAHLINFSGDLYSKKIRLGFISKIRDIIRFDTQDDLKNKIKSDIETTKNIYARFITLPNKI